VLNVALPSAAGQSRRVSGRANQRLHRVRELLIPPGNQLERLRGQDAAAIAQLQPLRQTG